MTREYKWGEENGEVYLIREDQTRKAVWTDIVSFPINQTGWEQLNSLILNLTQMRDNVYDLAYAPPVEYNTLQATGINHGTLRTAEQETHSLNEEPAKIGMVS